MLPGLGVTIVTGLEKKVVLVEGRLLLEGDTNLLG
jgi:hypothetical protein